MILAFIITAFLIEITPGPNMAYLALLAMHKGKANAFAAVMGIALGLLVVGFICAIGLAAIIEQSKLVYNFIRYAGIIYLLYLAYEAFLATSKAVEAHNNVNREAFGRYFNQGLITNLLNPKAYIFNISLLPEYIRLPEKFDTIGALPIVLIYSFIYVAIASLVHFTIVIFSNSISQAFSNSKITRNINYFAAVGLVCIAFWILFFTS